MGIQYTYNTTILKSLVRRWTSERMPESELKIEYYGDDILVEASTEMYILRLYVALGTPASSRAIHQIRKVCAEHLADRYDLQIIDIYQHPELLEQDKIFATPTLVKAQPTPVRRLVGDLPDLQELLLHLNL